MQYRNSFNQFQAALSDQIIRGIIATLFLFKDYLVQKASNEKGQFFTHSEINRIKKRARC